jgi:hypothetical protein
MNEVTTIYRNNRNNRNGQNTIKTNQSDHRTISRESGIHYNQHHHRQKHPNTRRNLQFGGKGIKTTQTRLK